MSRVLHLELREPTFQQLKRLRDRLGASSHAEVIRRALDTLEEKLQKSTGQKTHQKPVPISAIEMEREEMR